jgi:hypothetical protein
MAGNESDVQRQHWVDARSIATTTLTEADSEFYLGDLLFISTACLTPSRI